MNQVIQDKMKREVMVIANISLFKNYPRETLVYGSDEADFEAQILENFEFMVRGEAEQNFDYKQPITYAIVLNEKNEIFVYTRGDKNSAAWDARLHEKVSIWVGWHLEREEEHLENPIRDCLTRELEEEIDLKQENISEIFPIGYINDDSNEVGKVHIGMAYVVKTKNFVPSMQDGELAHGAFKSFEEFMTMIKNPEYNIESWTRLLAPELEKYM